MTHPEDVVMPMDSSEFNKHIGKQRVESGAISEHTVGLDLAKQGFIVSLPISRSPSFDLVASDDDIIVRVQVKTMTGKNKIYVPTGSRYTRGAQYVTGRKLKRQYIGTEFEILAGVDKDNWLVYYLPVNLLNFSTDTYKMSSEEMIQYRTIRGALGETA